MITKKLQFDLSLDFQGLESGLVQNCCKKTAIFKLYYNKPRRPAGAGISDRKFLRNLFYRARGQISYPKLIWRARRPKRSSETDHDHDQEGIWPWPDLHSGFQPKGNIFIKKFFFFRKFIFWLFTALYVFFFKLILSAKKPTTNII